MAGQADTGQTEQATARAPDAALLTFLAGIAVLALILVVTGAQQKPGGNQTIIEGAGLVLLVGVLLLAAGGMLRQRRSSPGAQLVNHPRSLGLAVALNLLVFVCLVAILTIGMTRFKVENTLSLPIMAIAGVVALIGTLSLTAISFSIMNLADKTQPLGLPQGSVRAVIALSLVVLFAILAVYLFSSLDTPTPLQTDTCVTAQDHPALLNALQTSGASVIVDIPSSAGCPAPAAAPAGKKPPAAAVPPTTFEVAFRIPPNPNAEDFAKQLLVLIGTLVTSVASFYFGSQAVSQAQAAMAGTNETTLLTGVDPPVLPSGGDCYIGVLGMGLNNIRQVQLKSKETDIPTLTAGSVTSNGNRVAAKFTIPAGLAKDTTLDVEVTDTSGRITALANAVTIGPPARAGAPATTSPATPPPIPAPVAARLREQASALAAESANLDALAALPAASPIRPPPRIAADLAAAQAALGEATSSADQTKAEAALAAATTALAAAQSLGLPAALADVLATLQGLAPIALPIIGGLPFGPIGIIGGVLMAGIKLYEDWPRLKTALLGAPISPALRTMASDAATATAALQAAPLFASLPGLAAGARTIMDQVLLKAPDGSLLPSTSIALALRADRALGSLLADLTLPQLAMAVDEFRAALVFLDAGRQVPGQIDLAGIVANIGAPTVALLLGEARKYAADPKGQAALEQLVAIAEALAKAPPGATLNARLRAALAAAQAIVAAGGRQAAA